MRTIELQSSPKGYTLDQDKVLDPTTTVQNALTSLEGHTRVELKKRPTAIAEAHAFSTVGVGMDTSGKGLTEEQAKASAVMEFAERHAWLSFDYQNYPGYRIASHRELADAGLPVPPPSYFLHNFIDVEDPETLLAEIVEIPLKWIAATRLTAPANSELYYPINFHNILFTSNGLAAGNSLEEAIVQGLCELVERENVYRFFVERRAGTDVELESLDHPSIRQTLAAASEAGIEFVLKDISSDLGVPTFIARGTRAADEGKLTHRGVGQGAHTDPQKAVVRALSEYFEGFSSLSAAEETSPINIGLFGGMLPKKHYGFHAFYNPEMLDPGGAATSISEVATLAREDFKEEAEAILSHLAGQGIDVAVVDKTHPEVEIPAVRLFAPSLRSCISTEFIGAPDLTLSAVCFEAGDVEASARHHAGALDRDPTWRTIKAFPLVNTILPALTQGMDPAGVWGKDFQESLIRIGKTKKGGPAMLADGSALMGRLSGLLGGLMSGAS